MQVREGKASVGGQERSDRGNGPGELQIHYEDMGDPSDPAVLLIMGLGAQLTFWREDFCRKLVDQGLRVVRFDNRDVGLSSHLDGQRTKGSQVGNMVRSLLGLKSPAVYTLEDMADDAAALLERLVHSGATTTPSEVAANAARPRSMSASYLIVIVLTASEDKNEFVQAMKLGCALPMGPFELLDEVGLDVDLASPRSPRGSRIPAPWAAAAGRGSPPPRRKPDARRRGRGLARG